MSKKGISFGTLILLVLLIGVMTSNTKSDTPAPISSYEWIESTDSCWCYFDSYTNSGTITSVKIIGLNESKSYVLEGGSDPIVFTGASERSIMLRNEEEEEDWAVRLGELLENVTVVLLDMMVIVVNSFPFENIGPIFEKLLPLFIVLIVFFGILSMLLRGGRMSGFLGFDPPRRSDSSSSLEETEEKKSPKGKEDDGRCSKCGTTKEDNDKYCLNCGHDLKKKYKPSKNNNNNDKSESRNEDDDNPLPFTNPDNKILDHFQDSDSDGTIDSLDIDDDGDGLPDVLDWDDDNDGIPDTFDWD